ncbi:NAD(P)H-binding protein [Undibacterium terreum]|uniref:Nucleotide-diphosphate-sugar epimerase n=1 Tax=Undibacterium terreum TaxID=1224302 RepID=A0A916XDW1_9BURK|nr:NAD(P)H-binding protein [Undibacterium terreum]GGC66311.1 nucleotide-diphosphate-sugar epimerase [Undibacterium terreum]
MKQRKYLITAATGKTGVHTIQQLLKGGHAVRAMVHSEDERSEALRQAGAEIIVGDLLEHDDVQRALDGISAAYLCYPVRPGFIQATAYFADAAQRAGLDVVVSMSQISARNDSESHAARDHWIAERVLDWSGVPAVHLRPTLFSEWLTFPWVRDLLVKEGKIAMPLANGRHAPIGAEDQARLIAAILTQPAAHVGKTYPLYGPVEFSQKELAEELSRILDRHIVYEPATLDEYRELLGTYQLPEFLIQHFLAIAVDYQNGIFAGVNNIIADVTGQPPQTVEQFVKNNIEAFKS